MNLYFFFKKKKEFILLTISFLLYIYLFINQAKSEVIMSMFLTLYPKYINLLLNG